MNRKNRKVVIVGAGPAGSTAAYYVRESEVVILDQHTFPRHKACGGGLLNAADWGQAFENFATIESQLPRHPIEDTVVYWDHRLVFTRPGPVGWHVCRDEFDNLLLETALAKGNVTYRRFRLTSVAAREGKVILSDGKEEIIADQVIGCDGWRSTVARFLGNPLIRPVQYGACAEFDIHCTPPDKVHLLFGWKREFGYGWVFPTRRGCYLGVGFIEPSVSIKKRLEELLSFCMENGIIPVQNSIERTFGAPDPLYVAETYAHRNILLAGDAMGLVKQVSGEGIYFAMISGKIAGETVDLGGNVETEYIQRIQPLIREVTFRRHLPPKRLGIAMLNTAFFLMSYAPGRERLQNILLNEIFRRYKLPTGSRYRRY